MKAIEIISESKKIEEGPAGIIGQAAKRLGAAALSAAGLKTWAGQLDDKADIGTFANRYAREFDGYLRLAGKKLDSATFGDLKDFMDKNSIPTHNVPNNPAGILDKNMVNSILTRTASDYLSGNSPAGSGSISKKTAKTGNAPATQAAPQAGQPTASAPASAPSASTGSQPFSIPALIQVIPQMNKKDLNRLNKAIQTALQNPKMAAQQAKATASSASNSTAGMTPAQTRAVKQAAAANAAQAQMKANPAPAPAQTPASIRAQKQQAAAANAQAQMATNAKPVAQQPTVVNPKSSVSTKTTSQPAVQSRKAKKAVAV